MYLDEKNVILVQDVRYTNYHPVRR